ncbi:MAG: GNAT family N-acetyltransferase [Phycisphaerales bacterium]|nr:GNAT family N-acetyltransferase [Phycisphaerales bacterium]
MPAYTLTAITPDEVSTVARFIFHAFASPPDQAAQWMERAGHGNLRVLREDGRPVASLLRIPMGQYFGGRRLGLLGIAGVAVPPEHRGRGHARRMMQMAMQEGAAEGFELSGLYASTQSLYRQVGFEQTAYRFRIEIPVPTIGVQERGGSVTPLADSDWPAIRECYARFAQKWDGLLDRGDYIWQRIHSMRGTDYTPFGVKDPSGGLSGYFFLNQQRKPESGRQNLELSDLVFNTADAGRRILGLLNDFGMMADDVAFFAGPLHPALLLMPLQRYRLTSRDTHLNRVLDFKRAVEARGYHPGLKARLEFEIHDDLVEINHGRWTVDVADGRAAAARGGHGGIRLSIRAFAPALCGYLTFTQLSTLGWAEGSADDLARADIFTGSTPWVPDMY